jgi:hypothetical protein
MAASKQQISTTKQLINTLEDAVKRANALNEDHEKKMKDLEFHSNNITQNQSIIESTKTEIINIKTEVGNGLEGYKNNIETINKLKRSVEEIHNQLKGDDDGNHNGEPSLIKNAEALNNKTKKTLKDAERALGVSTDASLFSEYINKERLYKNSGRFILFLQVILLTAIAGSAFWFFPFQNEVNIGTYFNFAIRVISISPLVFLSIILLRVYNVQKILTEEYAHKATLAKTIAGYRKQFDLNFEDKEYKDLFEDFQNAITANPSDRIATILNRKEPQDKMVSTHANLVNSK